MRGLARRANRSGQSILVGPLTELSREGLAEAPVIDLTIEPPHVVLGALAEVALRCGDASPLAAEVNRAIRGVGPLSSASRRPRLRGGAVGIR